MTNYTIYYYDIIGFEEDGTEIYGMETLECDNEQELDYYLAIINHEDIFDIKEA